MYFFIIVIDLFKYYSPFFIYYYYPINYTLDLFLKLFSRVVIRHDIYTQMKLKTFALQLYE